MITINNKFPIGSFVKLKTCDECSYQILSVKVYGDGSHVYEIINGCEISCHFEYEMEEALAESY